MNISLSEEMRWLVLTLLMTALMWVPYIINRALELGVLQAFWDPYGDTATKQAWATRMMSAHHNAVENLVVFVPLVILLELTGLHNETTAFACMIFFFARLLHYLVFTLAIPVLRVVSFLVGFVMQIVLIFELMN